MEFLDQRVPVDVGKAIIQGNERTKNYYFESELKTVLNQKLPLEKLKIELNTITNRLENTGMFESVNINLVINKFESSTSYFDADVVISVREKGIPFLKVESYVKSHAAGSSAPGSEVGAEIQGCLRNPLGFGDMHRISVARNSTGASRDYLLASHIPNILSTRNRVGGLDVTLKSSEENNSFFLYYNQKIHSLLMDLTAVKVFEDDDKSSPEGRALLKSKPQPHKFQIEVSSREEIPLGFYAFEENMPTSAVNDPTSTGWRRFFPSSWFASSSTSTSDTSSDIEAPVTPPVSLAPKLYPSPRLLPMCQTSTKLSGKYSYTFVDTRDSPTVPSRGQYLHSSTEIAVPPGTSTFIKQEVSAQAHSTLGPRIPYLGSQHALTLSVAGSLGLLLPLHTIFFPQQTSLTKVSDNVNTVDSEFVPLLDRFHLGGPNSLRGFNLFGIGPKLPLEVPPPKPASSTTLSLPRWPLASPDLISPSGPSLGGISKCSLLGVAAVPLPVPALATLGAKLFGFINFGGLGETRNSSFTNSLNPLFGQIRLSAGAGIVVPVSSIARLELTYAVPLLKSTTDATKPFQIGVSMTIN